MPKGDTYICALCGQPKVKGWSDEEAIAEYKAKFGCEPMHYQPVCEGCYKKVMAEVERDCLSNARRN